MLRRADLMGLRITAKILPKYFKEIVEGKKRKEFRQIDSLILVNIRTKEEAEFRVRSIKLWPRKMAKILPLLYPDVPFKEGQGVVVFSLGERLDKKKGVKGEMCYETRP